MYYIIVGPWSTSDSSRDFEKKNSILLPQQNHEKKPLDNFFIFFYKIMNYSKIKNNPKNFCEKISYEQKHW